MKFFKVTGAVVIVCIGGFFLGPKEDNPHLSSDPLSIESTDLQTLESSIRQRERSVQGLKPDNEARIIWADASHQKTPYSLVYLHGFSASQGEGDPLHRETASRYGMNMYLPRLADHGIQNEEAMVKLTVERLVQSAKEAIAVGQQIGERVIVMATSTGGTLGLYLAQNNPAITGLILYAPNIDLFDPNSTVLAMPWGLQIARLIKGGNYHTWEIDSARAAYWTSKYRLEALVQLRLMLNATMTKETFQNVTQPVFAGYYFDNEYAQDSTISVTAVQEMMDLLGTAEQYKREVAFPNVRHHVMACHLTSKDINAVRKETYDFIEEILAIEPVEDRDLEDGGRL